MPVVYQMVGVPGSGKSTYIRNNPNLCTLPVISTDGHVERYGKEVGKTYSEVFQEYMPTAVKLMMEDCHRWRSLKHDMVWDQTSTTVLSRKKKFKALPHYHHICIWIKTPPMDILIERLGSRPGKEVPLEVVKNMIYNFQEPKEEEGFKEIWAVETWK